MSCFEATHKFFKRVMVFVYAENYKELVDENKNLRVNQEVQAFLQEPVLFDEELEALGLKLPGESLQDKGSQLANEDMSSPGNMSNYS